MGGIPTSPSNMTLPASALVSTVSRLNEGAERQKLGWYKIERYGAFVRAMDEGAEPIGLVVCRVLASNPLVQMLVRRARQRGVPTTFVDPPAFRRLSRGARASGVIAILRQRWEPLPDRPQGTWLAVDTLRSTGNLGCILRTAEACGVQGLIVTGSADPFAPEVVQAAMSAIAGLRFVRASLPDLLAWSARTGATLVASSPRAELAWDALHYPDPMVLWLGEERDGLGRDVLSACHASVRIPILGRGDSLNVATAAGILLYEALRQRRLAG